MLKIRSFIHSLWILRPAPACPSWTKTASSVSVVRGKRSRIQLELLVIRCCSLQALKGIPIDIFYIHAPDRSVPFAETAAAINNLHDRGSFKRFGLSNFKAEEVAAMHDICKQNGYILPTVYQGNYNAVTRKNEEELFPLLRKLNISFYAYSPLAGGLLAKTPDQLRNPIQGSRFDPDTYAGKLYVGWYMHEAFLGALDKFQKLCKKQGVKPAQAAFSWLQHHSKLQKGDAIILGASTMLQLEDNLKDSEAGELNDGIVQAMEEMWESVKAKAPAYHF